MAIPSLPAQGAPWLPWATAVDGAARIAAISIATTVTASGALVVNKHNPVDATSGALTMTLPTGQPEGTSISVEKTDASVNLVSITGSIRGVAAQTINLAWSRETITFRADSAGSWWPISGHKTKTSLEAAFALRPTAVELMPLAVYGDSFNIAPGLQTTSGAEPQSRVAKRLGMGTATSYAVAGYGITMTAHRLLTGNALDPDGVAITRAGLWAAGTTGVVVIDAGKNDNLYIGGSTAQAQATVEQALRSILAMIASGTRVENTDASIVYGGAGTAWGTNADANADSGGNNHRTATGAVGATVTITLPGPGTWWLYSATLDAAAYGVTAVSYGVTVDGVAQADWVFPSVKRGRSQNSGIVPMARKFVVTGAGTHTVVLTGKSGGTFASFDFYAPAAAAPPLAVVRKQVKFRSFNGGGAWAWSGQGGGGGTDASLDALNAIIASVVAEFPNAVVSDPTVAWDKVTMIGADGVHPNDKGAACLADADEAAIRTAVAGGFFAGLNR